MFFVLCVCCTQPGHRHNTHLTPPQWCLWQVSKPAAQYFGMCCWFYRVVEGVQRGTVVYIMVVVEWYHLLAVQKLSTPLKMTEVCSRYKPTFCVWSNMNEHSFPDKIWACSEVHMIVGLASFFCFHFICSLYFFFLTTITTATESTLFFGRDNTGIIPVFVYGLS